MSLHSRHEHFRIWLFCFHSLPQVSCGAVGFTVLADLPQALHIVTLITMVYIQKEEEGIKSFYTFLCYSPSHRICEPTSSGIVASLVFRTFEKGGTLPQ